MADGAAGTGSGSDWCTVESDPGVFTEMLEKIGCTCVELEELYSLDDDSLLRLKDETNHVYGLIFLFKWVHEIQQRHAEQTASGGIVDEDDIPSTLFFAHQVTTNACATQAILSVILNAQELDASTSTSSEEGPSDDDDKPTMGTILSDLKSFTSSFPPHLKGVAITSSEEIRTAHNSFSRQDAFLQEGKYHLPSDKDEAFHFVAYVPHTPNTTVYELDGLQKGPIAVGTYESGGDDDGSPIPSWLVTARKAIQERMIAGGDHIKFNLMAVIQDKRIKLRNQLLIEPDNAGVMTALASEDTKREQWKHENQRRKHNYVPLCVQLLKELARKDMLVKLIDEAKERQKAKFQQEQQNNKKSASE